MILYTVVSHAETDRTSDLSSSDGFGLNAIHVSRSVHSFHCHRAISSDCRTFKAEHNLDGATEPLLPYFARVARKWSDRTSRVRDTTHDIYARSPIANWRRSAPRRHPPRERRTMNCPPIRALTDASENGRRITAKNRRRNQFCATLRIYYIYLTVIQNIYYSDQNHSKRLLRKG